MTKKKKQGATREGKGEGTSRPSLLSFFPFFFPTYFLTRPPPPPLPPPPSELCVLLYDCLKQATPTDSPLVIPFLVTFLNVLTLDLGIKSGFFRCIKRVQYFCCRLSDLLLVYSMWWSREALKSFFFFKKVLVRCPSFHRKTLQLYSHAKLSSFSMVVHRVSIVLIKRFGKSKTCT